MWYIVRMAKKTITLTGNNSANCINTLSKTLINPMKPAIPVISKSQPQYCAGDMIVLSIPPPSVATTYQWTGPNNFTSTSASPSITANAAAAGNYSLIITQGPCSSDIATITINASDIVAVPVASFTVLPAIPATVYIPGSVVFANTSTNANTYLWNFGDGTTSTDVNPVHNYTKKGEYTITLTATNEGLCNNSISKGKISIRYNIIIFIPNTFTPNGDGINDYFNVKITNIKTYHLQIFNRFGTRLYESTDITNTWKGIYNGGLVPVGVYYYLIDAVTLNDDPLKEAGSVTVLR